MTGITIRDAVAADASMLMTASEPDFPYRSPLAARIDSIRTQIQTAAKREATGARPALTVVFPESARDAIERLL